jgi:catechol 2,3-dioxygenase-like lactoylglutathione lyase family enzyme
LEDLVTGVADAQLGLGSERVEARHGVLLWSGGFRRHYKNRTSVLFAWQPSVRLTTMIHHVQIACPPGSEPVLRAFYGELLGLAELPKPPVLAARGGAWFAGFGIEVHLGVEQPFAPAKKAHPGLLWPGLDDLAARLEAAGHPCAWSDELPGYRRFYVNDPNGNRLEFLEPAQVR